jgi:hypothetical protein
MSQKCPVILPGRERREHLPGRMVGRLGIEPRTQGFLDRGSGCSWITVITCVFRSYKRSLSVVVSRCLGVFSDRKVSKRAWWLTFNLTALPAVHLELENYMTWAGQNRLNCGFDCP